jgi:hypothetical protein
VTFDDVIKVLGDLQQRATMLDGEHSITFDELFDDEFMLKNTDFETIARMITASGFKIDADADFAAIPKEQWDAFVMERTRFQSWEEMKSAAAQRWAARRLGFD